MYFYTYTCKIYILLSQGLYINVLFMKKKQFLHSINGGNVFSIHVNSKKWPSHGNIPINCLNV